MVNFKVGRRSLFLTIIAVQLSTADPLCGSATGGMTAIHGRESIAFLYYLSRETLLISSQRSSGRDKLMA